MSEPKIIYNRFLPFTGYAMVFFNRILARKKYKPLKAEYINHEQIHLEQIKECKGYIPFLLIYMWYWIRYRGLGIFSVLDNPFEGEAYRNQKNLKYLQSREKFAYKNYYPK